MKQETSNNSFPEEKQWCFHVLHSHIFERQLTSLLSTTCSFSFIMKPCICVVYPARLHILLISYINSFFLRGLLFFKGFYSSERVTQLVDPSSALERKKTLSSSPVTWKLFHAKISSDHIRNLLILGTFIAPITSPELHIVQTCPKKKRQINIIMTKT